MAPLHRGRTPDFESFLKPRLFQKIYKKTQPFGSQVWFLCDILGASLIWTPNSQKLLRPRGLLERNRRDQKIQPRPPRYLKKYAKKWLIRQALWQIYLPAPKRIPRPKFDVPTPNKVHQADLLFLPHDKLPRGRKVFKYALTVVDVASRYKEAEPLTSKNSDEVAQAFQKIYKRSPLEWPEMLQVDPGREFMGAVTQEMEKHKTFIRRGRVDIHRDQAIVERFNRTLAERLFGHQYAVEMLLPEGKRSTAWVKRLPEVVSALNNEVTSLIGKKPAVAIKEKSVYARPSTPYTRPVGKREKILPSLVQVRYLYQPGELEGGVKRATDPIWSLKVFALKELSSKPDQPVLYYLRDGPKRGFVREELLVVPPNTTLPPADVKSDIRLLRCVVPCP